MKKPFRFVHLSIALVLFTAVTLTVGRTLTPQTTVQASPAATAETLTLDSPHLGMWWPDTEEQSLDDIARYDWVILGDWQESAIAPLKARHPDLLLLNSTNACELSYDPDPNAPAWANEVRDIPAEWFLTQVGTTLTQPVNDNETIFHVNAVTATEGAETYALFIPGDTAVIEGESVFIQAVDEAAKTLTVQRGYARPASPHSAGTRIAAHISFWPGSWLLNLSTMSPTGTISATIGPERWGDYNARAGIALLDNPGWDGLLIDRADPDESWLIGSSTARTIDPDQSNTLLTDYSAFDAAWNDGLRQYEQAIRDAVGPDRIIFVNWGMANTDLLNGNNFEGFPGDDTTAYGRSWHETVFGPTANGSYFDWMAQAQQPNLTMIETYEDDSGADPTGDGSYDNPCADPNFVPNYRKMRFGLATTLLNDGFFSYEINTNGHGSLCLLWFDEYDNAGQGRGYLGQPLGPAYRPAGIVLGENLLQGGDFESQSDLDLWDLWADDGYAATMALSPEASSGNSSARINVTQSQGTDWQISFDFQPVEVISGTEYTLSFWAKADQNRPISAWAQQMQAPWESYLGFGDELNLTTEWQQYELSATASGSDALAGFSFGLGQAVGSVWLDDVQLRQGSSDVWRRDYAGGAVLINATAVPQTIDLGGEFRKIDGTQDTAVNDGSLVTQVVLPPHDGLILLRQLDEKIYLPMLERP